MLKITNTIAGQISFSEVAGIGDAAAWDHMDNALVILAGRAKFKIYVDISGETEENIALAKKLAHLVLSKCS